MSQYILHAYPIWDSLVTLKKYISSQSQPQPTADSNSPSQQIAHAHDNNDGTNNNANCIYDADNTNHANNRMAHWLTFWILSFGINQLPLPDVVQWVLTSLLFFPSSTSKAQNVLIEYMPTIQENTMSLFTKLKAQLSKHVLQTIIANNQLHNTTNNQPNIQEEN